jgi:hypothetical protein
MSAPTKELKFLAVARRADKAVLASRVHTADKAYDYLAKVHQVMNSPGWATVTTDRLSLEDGGYMFYVSIDEVRAGGGRAAAGARRAGDGSCRVRARAPRARA